jgi:anhydro-N-acetylmuramic acid kinase
MAESPVRDPGPAIVVGLMSGTSLDGISAAAVRFADGADGRVTAELLAFRQEGYTPAQRGRLEAALRAGTAAEYCALHADLGRWFGDAACAVMADAGVTPAEVAAVASHGQTAWHAPPHGTWQLGDPAQVAERTGCAVVSDFRTRDVAAGGQGAPLVPIADLLLFARPDGWRALQNIGGIGNVTVVPPWPAGVPAPGAAVRAFDTGPGVVVLDSVVRALFPLLPYDRGGAIAAAGTVLEPVVAAALRDPFFAAPPPKSTGREWFTPAYVARFVADCRGAGGTPADAVATATAFTARSIADQYARFLPHGVTEVLVSGGGARNPTLVRALEAALRDAVGDRAPAVRPFEAVYFDGEAKEAVAFALLGYLHLRGRPGNLPAATGASAPRVLGSLTPR